MKTLLLGVVAIAIAVLLSSCALLRIGQGGVILDDSHEQADAQMELIAAAVNDGDAAALKALFSTRALERATDIDAGLDYFLSLFPDGGVTWKRNAIGSESESSSGNRTKILRANYKLSVDGEDYWLYFADFTVNDFDPQNVGLYVLGVTVWTEDFSSGEAEPFSSWFSGIGDGAGGNGYPAIYVPA